MSTAEKRLLTAEEYRAVESIADVRHEFHDGEMFAMGGGTLWHNLIKDNCAHSIRKRIECRGCRVVTSDQRVKVEATGLYTYPDVVVFCGAATMEDGIHHTLTNPLLIVEVLSESIEKYDRGIKFGHYRRLTTLREYVLVAQDRLSVEVFLRQTGETDPAGNGDNWMLSTAAAPNSSIHLGTLGISVPLAELYDGVEFPAGGKGAGHQF